MNFDHEPRLRYEFWWLIVSLQLCALMWVWVLKPSPPPVVQFIMQPRSVPVIQIPQ